VVQKADRDAMARSKTGHTPQRGDDPDRKTFLKSDYWNPKDEQVVGKAGKLISQGIMVLYPFRAPERNPTTLPLIYRTSMSCPLLGQNPDDAL
jgi:hypothetical protein